MTERSRISCEQALRLLAEYLDGELSDLERHDVRHHLDTCRSCYSRVEFETRLRVEIASLARVPVPNQFEERVRTLIGHFESIPDHPPTTSSEGGSEQ
jgi:anti-sigma factor (TIGR02949 family)